MSRLFAVIPGAGRSRRMGQPKLLLPWGTGRVIEQVLRCFEHPAVVARLVVVRSDDQPLAQVVTQAGGIVLTPPVEPPEMRDSVQHALDWIEREWHPQPDDGWILSPADHPLLESQVLHQLVAHWLANRPEILIPVCGGKRGHPVLFRWWLAAKVRELPAEAGLNLLVRQNAALVRELPLSESGILADLDTPEDYQRLRGLEEARHQP